MKLTGRVLFMLAELMIDRAVDKTAGRTVCETVMVGRAVEDKCVSCRKASVELEPV